MPKNFDAEKNNPCLKEQQLTYKCLSDSKYDHDKCGNFFENYNSCKAFWNRIKSDRRREGISPNMPDVAEREQIKEEYKRKFPKTNTA